MTERDGQMRLRRIRFKDGRAPIEILHTLQDATFNGAPESIRGAMMKGTKQIVAWDKTEMDGFIVIGFFADGSRSLGFRIPSRISREMLPHYVAEMIRTDVITDNAASQEFDRRFEWKDG